MKNPLIITFISIVLFSNFLLLIPEVVNAIPCSVTDRVFKDKNGKIIESGQHDDTKTSIVPCGQYANCPCEIGDVFVLINRLYDYILAFATVVAGLLIVIGGTLLILSGGFPKLYDTAKSIIRSTIIAIALLWISWILVSALFLALGYKMMPWDSFNIKFPNIP